jgi:leucyl aminopeptidase (aminopeptidase T)
MLDADEGARYLGEFAIGVNNAVTVPSATRSTMKRSAARST